MKARYALFLILLLPLASSAAFYIKPDDRKWPEKPSIYLVEAKIIIMEYVEEMSQLYKTHMGQELSAQQKAEIRDETLTHMIAQGSYRFIAP